MQQTSPAAAEYGVARNYLDWILALPWQQETEDKLDLKAAEKILNEQHFGLAKVKDRLLEFLAVLKRRKEIKGPILCLVGPPGVGKTSLGKSVADALGRKFARISLGGMRDEAEIRGHRRTYVGALPGRIIQTLRRIESRNPVILLDELDKIGADFRGDPASALLEVLDPAQNHTFTDHYLDLPFDLSRVLFIATANWLDPIHPALRDRLEVIELPSYTETEKLQIAKRYLVPRQLEEHGLTRSDVKFSDAALRQLIRDYTREAGVRQLEREIAALARKSARKIVARNGSAQTVKLEAKDLKSYLGHARFVSESAEKIDEIGIATGLAWTPVGGDVLFIEATRMRGRGSLILTGSLGEVMKESAQTAVSYLRSQAKKLHLDFDDYGKNDLHIHVPAGATPKDGPSAGVTICAALASLMSKRRVRSDVAMTGEISLRGRVMRVGGIKEKVIAAVTFWREAGDFAGRQQAGLGGRAGGSAREIEGAFREADFRSAATGACGEMNLKLSKVGGASVPASRSLQTATMSREDACPIVFGFRGTMKTGQPRRGRILAGSCLAAQIALGAMVLLLSFSAKVEAADDDVVAMIQGRKLAAQLLEQQPAENFIQSGNLTIRGPQEKHSVKFKCTVQVMPDGWSSTYEAFHTNGTETLVIFHQTDQSHRMENDFPTSLGNQSPAGPSDFGYPSPHPGKNVIVTGTNEIRLVSPSKYSHKHILDTADSESKYRDHLFLLQNLISGTATSAWNFSTGRSRRFCRSQQI